MKSITIILFFIVHISLFAQEETYFNEWIDFSKTYHKFYIEEDGLYRIPYSVLEVGGLNAKSSEGFHLFSRGQEIPIYISSNGELSSEDYIEFYGQKNDGSFDTQLFESPDWQVTNRQSLFTHSIAYYLMWDDGFEGLRLQTIENQLGAELPTKEEYFMYESTRINRNVFSNGDPTIVDLWEEGSGINQFDADFGKGEGFSGIDIRGETNKVYSLNTFGVHRNSNVPKASLEIKIRGEIEDEFIENNHHFQLYVNDNLYLNEVYEGFDMPIYETFIELEDLDESKTLFDCHSVGDLTFIPHEDWQSVSYITLTYPREFDFTTTISNEIQDATEFYFELQHPNEAYFEVEHFNGGNQTVLYDLTNLQRYEIEASEGLYEIHLIESASIEEESRKLLLANTDETVIKTVEELQSFQFTDYENIANQGGYILITHPSLREGDVDWVEAYATYRRSKPGGSYFVVIVDIEELYDQFAQGIQRHPLSIRHFVNFAIEKWTKEPRYLFLMGKGMEYHRLEAENSIYNLIPSFGRPCSDILLSAKNIKDSRPQLGTGRLSVVKPSEIEDFINKIKQYENLGPCNIEERAWRKKMLLQASASEEEDYTEYGAYVESYQKTLENNFFGGKTLDVQVYRSGLDNFQTRPFLREGVGILHHFGRSSTFSWNTDISGFPIAHHQVVAPHFPFVISGGFPGRNNFGSYTNSVTSQPMSRAWVLSKNRGAIGFFGHAHYSRPVGTNFFLEEFFQQITETNYNQPVSKSIKETIEKLFIEDASDPFYHILKTSIESFSYEGDPVTILGGGFDRAEYVIKNDYEFNFIDVEDEYTLKTETRRDVVLLNAATGSALQLSGERYDLTGIDEISFKVRVTNLGKNIQESLELSVVKINEEGIESTLQTQTFASPAYEGTYEWTLPIEAGEALERYDLVLRVNANSAIAEDCYDNNEISFPVSKGGTSIRDFWEGGKISLYPNPFTDELQIHSTEKQKLTLQLYDLQGRITQTQIIPEGSTTLQLSNLPKGIYWVRLTGEKGVWSQKILKQ